jgi:hypothetical protein
VAITSSGSETLQRKRKNFAVAVEFTMAPSALPQCNVSGVIFVTQFFAKLLLKTVMAEFVKK